jgi:hypothetical protein
VLLLIPLAERALLLLTLALAAAERGLTAPLSTDTRELTALVAAVVPCDGGLSSSVTGSVTGSVTAAVDHSVMTSVLCLHLSSDSCNEAAVARRDTSATLSLAVSAMDYTCIEVCDSTSATAVHSVCVVCRVYMSMQRIPSTD